MRVARRWRSSASPSSAPSSASPRCRRSGSSGTPWSCGTASRGCGPRSRRVRVPAWRARSVAEATIHAVPALTVEAAGWVDVQVAAVAGKVGPAQLDRLVAEAIKRYDLMLPDPAADPEDGYLAVDPRHATLHDRGRALRRDHAARGRARPRRRPRPGPGAGPRRRHPQGPRVGTVPRRPSCRRARRPRPDADRARPPHPRPHRPAGHRRPSCCAGGRAARPLRRRRRWSSNRVRANRAVGGRAAAGAARPGPILVR